MKKLWYNKVIGESYFINLIFSYKVYIYVTRISLKVINEQYSELLFGIIFELYL